MAAMWTLTHELTDSEEVILLTGLQCAGVGGVRDISSLHGNNNWRAGLGIVTEQSLTNNGH